MTVIIKRLEGSEVLLCLTKRVPFNLKVRNLRMICGKSLGLNGRDWKALHFQCIRKKSQEVFFLEDDLKGLDFYDVVSGDEILLHLS